MRGQLNEYRAKVVDSVFTQISFDNFKDLSESISSEHFCKSFNLDSVAQFKNGQRTAKEILGEMLAQIDQNEDGMISRDEFIDFYTNVGVSFENDLVFEKFVRSSWAQFKDPAQTIMRRT